MVGFEVGTSSDFSKTEFLIAGCVSGFISRACVQPLDVVKVRFQLQVESITPFESSAKYRSCMQAVRCIFAEEGIKAFWKGHLSSQLLAVSYSGVQFLSFETFTRWWAYSNAASLSSVTEKTALSPSANFICGCLAGVTSAIFTQPLDVLKTRFIAQGEPRTYKNLGDAVLCIAHKDGPRGFFRGLSPALLLTAPQTGLQFAIYKLVNHLICTYGIHFTFKTSKSSSRETSSIGLVQSIGAGGVAGVASKCLVYPMDVAKKRLQVQGFEEARSTFGRLHSSKNLRDCFLIMWREEGPTAIFKGLKPSLVKSCVSIGCRFGAYEQVCSFMAWRHKFSQHPRD